MFNTEPLESFYEELMKVESVKEELRNELGKDNANKIIQQFKDGIPYNHIKGDFEEVISDFVENNGDIQTTLTGVGSYGEFPIHILNFGPLYWVDAQEFDSIVYFKSVDDAISCAEWEYEAFINDHRDK